MSELTNDWIEKVTAELLAAARGGVFSPEAQRHAARLTRKLQSYFRRIRSTFPMDMVMQRARRHLATMQEAMTPVEEEFYVSLAEWSAGEREVLDVMFIESINGTTRDGYAIKTTEYADMYGLPVPQNINAMVPNRVLEWVPGHSATLVKGITETTRKQLAGVIATGLKEQLSPPQIAKEIGAKFREYSERRCELIALTETHNALAEGSWRAADDVGSQEKSSITTGLANVCDVCLDNAAEGWISIDDEFPSGHVHNPFHPGCHCDVLYRGATKSSVEDQIAGLVAALGG